MFSWSTNYLCKIEGQKFAMMEQKVLVSTVLRNFHVESLDKESDLWYVWKLVLRTRDGIRLRLKPKMSWTIKKLFHFKLIDCLFQEILVFVSSGCHGIWEIHLFRKLTHSFKIISKIKKDAPKNRLNSDFFRQTSINEEITYKMIHS